MKNITPIKNIIAESLDDLKGNSNSYLKYILIAIKRLRAGAESYFFDFIAYLKNLTKNDLQISFYANFYHYLHQKLSFNPWTLLTDYLTAKGFSMDKMQDLELFADDETLLESLPQSKNFITILIFYLFRPLVVQKYFIYNFTFSMTKNDCELLNYYQSLSPAAQRRVIGFTRVLLEQERGFY